VTSLREHERLESLRRTGAPIGLSVSPAGEESWRVDCPLLGLQTAGPTLADACRALLVRLERIGVGIWSRHFPGGARDDFLSALNDLAAVPRAPTGA